jgi:hypothetical protein
MNAFHTLTMALGIAALSAPTLSAQTPRFASLDQMIGGDAGSRFGETFATLGDLNFDGASEFAVGSPGYNSGFGLGSGRVTVYSGATRQVLYHLDGIVGVDSLLGLTLDVIGDFDHDGHGDLLIGAGGHVPAYIVSAATGIRLVELVSNTNGQVGMQATVIGDVNGDSFPEFVLGFPAETRDGHTSSGLAIVYNGTTALPMHEIVGSAAFDSVGEIMIGPGDLNADGTPDLLIGIPSLDNYGLTAVSGANGEILYHLKRADLGMRISDLAVTGDFNQDGHDDFLATGYRYGNSGLQWVDGVAKIFSGADGSLLMTHSDGHLEDFGRRSEAIGDVNGDGFQDIGLIATPLSQSWQVRPTVIIISGQDGHEMARLSSPTPQGLVLTLGGIGDTNNDGRDEFLIGVPQDWFAQSTYFGQAQVMTLLN